MVLLMCGVFVALAAWQAPLLVSRSSTQFSPPPSTLAAKGNAALEVAFPGRGVASSFALLIQQSGVNRSWVSSEAVKKFSLAVNDTLLSLSVAGCGSPCVLFVEGYWALRNLGLPMETWAPFANEAGNATYVAIQVNTPFSSAAALDWAARAQVEIAALATTWIPDGDVTLLGIPAFIPVMIHDIEINLGLIGSFFLSFHSLCAHCSAKTQL